MGRGRGVGLRAFSSYFRVWGFEVQISSFRFIALVPKSQRINPLKPPEAQSVVAPAASLSVPDISRRHF